MSRPRKSTVRRDASGKSRGESRDVVCAVAVAQRIRAGAPPKEAHSHLWGFTLGILRCLCQITEDEFQAGYEYAEIVHRHNSLMGLAMPFPKSPSTIMVSGGNGGERREPDDAEVISSRRKFSDCRRILLDPRITPGAGWQVNKITFEVCVENRSVDTLSPADHQNLRVGLNALGKVLR